MTRLVAGWILLWALYLLFAGQLTATEVAAGGAAGLLCAVLAQQFNRAGQRRFSPEAPWGRLLKSIFRALLVDPAHVAAAILRGRGGHIQRQAFAGGGHEAAGRRALVTLAMSLAPNGMVVAVERDALLIHRLRPCSPSPDRHWPL